MPASRPPATCCCIHAWTRSVRFELSPTSSGLVAVVSGMGAVLRVLARCAALLWQALNVAAADAELQPGIGAGPGSKRPASGRRLPALIAVRPGMALGVQQQRGYGLRNFLAVGLRQPDIEIETSVLGKGEIVFN